MLVSSEISCMGYKKVLVPIISGWAYIRLDSIRYLKADSSHTFMYLLKKNELILNCNLQKIEGCLPAQFFRCHKSYIINLLHVKSIKIENSTINILLECNTQIPLAKRRKVEFFEALKANSGLV